MNEYPMNTIFGTIAEKTIEKNDVCDYCKKKIKKGSLVLFNEHNGQIFCKDECSEKNHYRMHRGINNDNIKSSNKREGDGWHDVGGSMGFPD